MPANIVLRNLTTPPVKAEITPYIATEVGLRDGTRTGGEPGVSGGDATLSWLAVNGFVEDGILEIETDGTFNFGSVGPELVILMEPHRMPVGTIELTDFTAGPSTTLAWQKVDAKFTVAGNVTGAPNSKGIVMGGKGAELNPTAVQGRLQAQYTPSTRSFESRTFFWPQAQQDAAATYLSRSDPTYASQVLTWQLKPVWNMADFNFVSDDTDFFIEPGTALYDAQSLIDSGSDPYFKTGTILASNSVGTVYANMQLLNPVDPYKRVYAEPCWVEYRYDQGTADGVTNDAFLGARTGTTERGPLATHLVTNQNISEPQGTNKVVDSFTYPGYIRGFSIDFGANLYELELYKTRGPGAFCRVALSDNQDYFAASKKVILEPKTWTATKVTARLRETWFDLSTASGLWINIIGIDDTQIASVQI